MRHFISKLLLLSLSLVSFAGANPALAAPNALATVAFEPSSITTGDQVTVTVNVNVSEFTAASLLVRLNYDSSKLDYVSTNDEGSAYPNQFTSSSTDASRFTGRATNSGGTTGNKKAIAYVFKSKATGTATFSFSDLAIADLDGNAKSISGETKSLAIAAPVTAAPTSAPTAEPTAAPTSAPTATPKATAAPATAKPTTAKPATAKPATAKPKTPVATTTPAPVATTSTPDISASQSTVTLSKDTAVADGIDAISLCVVVKRNDGTVVTDIEPTISGLRLDFDTSLPFIFSSTDQTWCTDISSTAAGIVSVTIAASNVTLATQDLTYTEAPVTEPILEPTDSGKSFGLYIFFGIIGLLLLLLLLFFLYRKLRDRRDEEDELDTVEEGGPAYPGDDSPETGGTPEAEPAPESSPEPTPAESTPVAAPKDDESATTQFDANQALQRTPPPQS